MPTGWKRVAARPIRDIALESLLLRIIGEYREMPGLSVTAKQAQRLWRLDESTRDRVLSALVERGFLAVTGGGTYVRRE
jgi:hypothetical protein